MLTVDEYKRKEQSFLNGLDQKTKMPIEKGGGPPNDGNMERLAKLEARLDTVLPTLATKGDVADLKATIAEGRTDTVKTNTTVVIAGVSIVIAVIVFVSTLLVGAINRIPTTQPAPVILQLPLATGAATASGSASLNTTPSQVAPGPLETKKP